MTARHHTVLTLALVLGALVLGLLAQSPATWIPFGATVVVLAVWRAADRLVCKITAQPGALSQQARWRSK